MQIGVAHTAGRHADEYFASPRLGYGNLFDAQPAGGALQGPSATWTGGTADGIGSGGPKATLCPRASPPAAAARSIQARLVARWRIQMPTSARK